MSDRKPVIKSAHAAAKASALWLCVHILAALISVNFYGKEYLPKGNIAWEFTFSSENTGDTGDGNVVLDWSKASPFSLDDNKYTVEGMLQCICGRKKESDVFICFHLPLLCFTKPLCTWHTNKNYVMVLFENHDFMRTLLLPHLMYCPILPKWPISRVHSGSPRYFHSHFLMKLWADRVCDWKNKKKREIFLLLYFSDNFMCKLHGTTAYKAVKIISVFTFNLVWITGRGHWSFAANEWKTASSCLQTQKLVSRCWRNQFVKTKLKTTPLRLPLDLLSKPHLQSTWTCLVTEGKQFHRQANCPVDSLGSPTMIGWFLETCCFHRLFICLLTWDQLINYLLSVFEKKKCFRKRFPTQLLTGTPNYFQRFNVRMDRVCRAMVKSKMVILRSQMSNICHNGLTVKLIVKFKIGELAFHDSFICW